MKYNDVLKDIIMRPNHKFICGDRSDKNEYLKKLAQEFSFNNNLKSPVGVYINDTGLAKCTNASCDKVTLTSFNERYLEMVLAYEIIDKLTHELPQEAIEKVSLEILRHFNYGNKENKFSTLEELKQELLKTKNIYLEEYEHYIRTGQLNDFMNKLRIFMVLLEPMIRSMKNILPNLDCIHAFIDKNSKYSITYTQTINFYIGARSNGFLNINIGCDNFQDWETYYDINGNLIQAIHDFDYVDMREYKLVRKR